MNQRDLRDHLGLFATGVIIACARRKNFLAREFFSRNFFSEKILSHDFFKLKIADTALGKNIVQKLKKIFADEFFGMTRHSFTAVSLNPPLVSFCVSNRSSNLSLFKKNRYFSFNILSREQQALAAAFATPKNSKKWKVEPYFFSKFGNPIFQNSLAFFECEKFKVIKSGDHHIIIGKILNFAKIGEKEPLLYFRGHYDHLR
jgi:flavin reductase (DIM6/NTAB) family NADH-FMN oxidoreductase RutF